MPRTPLSPAVVTARTLQGLKDARKAGTTLSRMIDGSDIFDPDAFETAVRKLEAAGCQTRRAYARGQLGL